MDKAIKVITDHSSIEIEVLRDRESNFEPQIIGKRQNRINGFDDKVIRLYASGLSTKDIANQLKELYGLEISASLVSSITSQVTEQVRS